MDTTPRPRWRRPAAWASLLGAAAFGVVAIPSQANDALAEAPEFKPAEATVLAAAGKALAGRYAHYDVVAYVDPAPAVTVRSLVITYGFTRLTWTGQTLESEDTFCHAEHKSNLPVQSQVPDAFTRAILPRKTAVILGQSDGAFQVFRPETPTPIGYKPLTPDEPFPTDANDPRIFDSDQDGHPGVTVNLKLGGFVPAQLYLARLERFAYVLTQGTGRVLEGRVIDKSQQLVLGASVGFLARASNPAQDPDPKKNPIVLRPVEDTLDCDGLMARRDDFFPKEPASP